MTYYDEENDEYYYNGCSNPELVGIDEDDEDYEDEYVCFGCGSLVDVCRCFGG